MTDSVIIGAGPAGLTAAYELTRHGERPLVLEADRQVGGLSRTVEKHGFRFDIGGHRFFSKVPIVNDLWREILGDELLSCSRLSRIYYRDRFFDYPLKPLNALAGLGPVEVLLVTASYTKARLFPEQSEVSFEQWVSNRFGRRLFEIFFKTYTEKVWGMPCSEISADWAAQRIKNLSLAEAARNALTGSGRGSNGQLITSLVESFEYPRLGPGMMWERCHDLVAARGGETVPGVRVERIRHRHGAVECLYGRTADGELLEFAGDEFISTMPLPALAAALDPAPPADVMDAARSLRFRDYLTVVLIVRRERVFPDNWIYIHSPEVDVGRIQNYKNWSADMVPDPSRTSLGLEYFLSSDDEKWRWSDDRLIENGIRECTKLRIVEPSEVEHGVVVRMRNAYPVYDHGYREKVARVRTYLETIPNLQTIGRNGLHRYNNQDHSMLTGVYAARNTLGERNDVWSVNAESEYHEESRTEMERVGRRLVPVGIGSLAAGPQQVPETLVEEAFPELDSVALGAAVCAVSVAAVTLATAILLLKGGPTVGPHLTLLSQYLVGYEVSWTGLVVGAVEVGVLGFLLGWAAAFVANWSLSAYVALARGSLS